MPEYPVNINRDWIDRAEPETQAVAALFSQYNFIAAVDAHSGGYARQVNMREAEGVTVKAAVRERSQRLYDAVFAMYESEGYEVRRYSDEPVSDDPSIFRNGVALVEHIPTLLIEVPAQWANGMYSVNPPLASHGGAAMLPKSPRRGVARTRGSPSSEGVVEGVSARAIARAKTSSCANR